MSETAVNASILTALQSEALNRLLSESYFSDITGYVEDDSVTLTKIQNTLRGIQLKGGKQGAAFVVRMPRLVVSGGDVAGPEGVAEIVVECVHLPVYNDTDRGGTGKDADEIALYAVNTLHEYLPRGLDGVRGNFMAGTDAIEPVGASEKGVAYLARVRVPVTVGRTRRVARPAASAGGGNITATCSTAGASIYFTTDGSYPGSGNSAATLYSAPFAEPSTPYAIRFGAELSGSIPSNTLELEAE